MSVSPNACSDLATSCQSTMYEQWSNFQHSICLRCLRSQISKIISSSAYSGSNQSKTCKRSTTHSLISNTIARGRHIKLSTRKKCGRNHQITTMEPKPCTICSSMAILRPPLTRCQTQRQVLGLQRAATSTCCERWRRRSAAIYASSSS